jgi:hypothetical protein
MDIMMEGEDRGIIAEEWEQVPWIIVEPQIWRFQIQILQAEKMRGYSSTP